MAKTKDAVLYQDYEDRAQKLNKLIKFVEEHGLDLVSQSLSSNLSNSN
jgi:hypothetical protein